MSVSTVTCSKLPHCSNAQGYRDDFGGGGAKRGSIFGTRFTYMGRSRDEHKKSKKCEPIFVVLDAMASDARLIQWCVRIAAPRGHFKPRDHHHPAASLGIRSVCAFVCNVDSPSPFEPYFYDCMRRRWSDAVRSACK